MDEKKWEKIQKQLEEQYPFGILRKDLEKATGDILSKGTEANRDSLGVGIPGRFKIGRQVVYPVPEVVRSMRSRVIRIV